MDSFLSSQRKSLSDCDYTEFRSRLVSSSVDKLLKKSGAAIDAILAAAKDPTAAASPDSPIHLELVNHRLASYPSCSQPLTAHSPPLSASSSSVPSDLLLVGLCLLHQPYIPHLPHFLSSYAVLSRYLTNHFLRVGIPGRLVLPLGSFLLHLSSCPSVRRCFTPIHRDFALVSLKSRFYRISSDVLSCPLDRVASSSECPIDDSSEFLEYCYYTAFDHSVIIAILKKLARVLLLYRNDQMRKQTIRRCLRTLSAGPIGAFADFVSDSASLFLSSDPEPHSLRTAANRSEHQLKLCISHRATGPANQRRSVAPLGVSLPSLH